MKMSNVLESIVQDIGVSMSIHDKRKSKVVTNVCNAERASTFWKFLSTNKTDSYFFCGDGTNCFIKKTRPDYENKNPSRFSKKTFRP